MDLTGILFELTRVFFLSLRTLMKYVVSWGNEKISLDKNGLWIGPNDKNNFSF